MPSLANSGYFLAILSDTKVFSNGNIVFDDPKEFDDPQVFDGLKGISIGSMDFDINPKVNGETQIFDGLVLRGQSQSHFFKYADPI